MSYKKLLFALLIATLLPLTSLAVDIEKEKGTVTINVYDENNQKFSGNWFLHQGTSTKGRIVRNGTSGETFDIDDGNYYLEAQRKNSRYNYYIIYSNNPQTLEIDGEITYKIQYFKTQEDFETAKANGDTTPTPTPTPEPPTPTPAPTPTPEPPTPTPTPIPTPTNPTADRDYLGPDPSSSNYVPLFNISPVDNATEQTTESENELSQNLPLQLAETGNPALLLLVISGLAGGLAVRKRK